ncbi:CDP-glycerol glycerophosphotransferase family protein [Microbacterium sp. bgisy203]|uniref:CDP-glycerol glycerophosphotransferase family protein n=1 Tax=Microbacterium sp. bgisy203 TaxID=3413799 RepID=UPI003D703D69
MASFSFGAGNAGKLLRIPLYVAGRAVTAVVPRSRELWVFGSAVGLADGAWALWQHASAAGERAVWLTGTADEAQDAAARGILHAPKTSLRGFWLTARAAVTVITHGFGDVNRYAATGGVIVQLWHGIPLKRIGLDAPVTTASPLPFAAPLLRRALAALYRRTQARIRVLPAASDLVRGRLESAFGLPSAHVPVTGDPRDDVLSTGTAAGRRAAARARLAALIGPIDAQTPVVLYAPTWRDGAADPGLPASADLAALRAVLADTGAVFLVRAHHLGAGDYAALAGGSVRLLGSDVVADVTPLLPGVDTLVTDYSSLAYDAALARLATVFFAPDLDGYARSRGFYGTYAEVAGDDPATTWPALLAQLRAVLTDPAERAARVARAGALSARVHRFADGRNTARVYRAIRARIPATPGRPSRRMP